MSNSLKTYFILHMILALYAFPANDLVKDLIDYPKNLGRMFSGYLNVGDTGKRLFYVFVESQNKPANDPLVLWLNGGPGVSSLVGFSQINGPAIFDNDSFDLRVNPYSWNKIANMIYLESPVDTGFSYGKPGVKYNQTDETSADDNLEALKSFFTKFPEYKANRFYLSGESYAGIYTPYLADRIRKYNEKLKMNCDRINLVGLLIGNGLTDKKYELITQKALTDFFVSRDMLSDYVADDYHTICSTRPTSKECSDAVNALMEQLGPIFANINLYDVYRTCDRDGINVASPNFNFSMITQELLKKKVLINENCNDDSGPIYYFNRADVRSALHVEQNQSFIWTTLPIHNHSKLNYDPTVGDGTLKLYPEILKNNVSILFYSGNTDAIVSTTGTKKWIKSLNMKIQPGKERLMWNATVNSTIGGWVTYYENNFTFIEVHGAGHMVPKLRPKEAYKVFYSFMNSLKIEKFDLNDVLKNE